VIMHPDGTPFLGANGEQIAATDKRVPKGGRIGPNGIILDKDGMAVLGPNRKPLVAVLPGASPRSSSVLQYAKSLTPAGAKDLVDSGRKRIGAAFSRGATPAGFSMEDAAPVYQTDENGKLVIKDNWFKRMREREHLGGKKRDQQQLMLMSLQDQLAKQVAAHGKTILSKNTAVEIETTGMDARARPSYQRPEEYLLHQEQMVNELAAFIGNDGQDKMRSKLKKTPVSRAVPWQDKIEGNPQSKLKPAGKVSRALTGLDADADVTA